MSEETSFIEWRKRTREESQQDRPAGWRGTTAMVTAGVVVGLAALAVLGYLLV